MSDLAVKTVADLRALLSLSLIHADNTALSRCERTAKTLSVAYLPPMLPARNEPGDQRIYIDVADIFDTHVFDHYALALEVPGTAHALLVALALAKGLDPGPLGMGVMWERDDFHGRWDLCTIGGYRTCFMDRRSGHTSGRSRIRHVYAPSVALETNPIAALEAAVKHTLEQA